MTWFVVAFEKTGEEWGVQTIPTPGIDEEFVRHVWSLPDDDPVIGAAYRITSVEVARVQDHMVETIDLDSYNYELRDEQD